MTITATKRLRGARYKLTIDAGEDTIVSEETFLRFQLYNGKEIEESEFLQIRKFEDLRTAKTRALRLLSYRPRSVSEIRRKLQSLRLPDDVIDESLAYLRSSGYLNDREFARMFVRDRLLRRPLGPSMLMRKLLEKGIERLIAEESIQSELPADQLISVAESTIRRKSVQLRRAARLHPLETKKKLFDMLLRKGFSPSTAREVIKKLLSSETTEIEDNA